MKELLYYGVEKDGKSVSFLFPSYIKGVFCHKLQEGENEMDVRKSIEERCKANPDAAFCGMRLSHFRWIT